MDSVFFQSEPVSCTQRPGMQRVRLLYQNLGELLHSKRTSPSPVWGVITAIIRHALAFRIRVAPSRIRVVLSRIRVVPSRIWVVPSRYSSVTVRYVRTFCYSSVTDIAVYCRDCIIPLPSFRTRLRFGSREFVLLV